jgi:hypothetical protein
MSQLPSPAMCRAFLLTLAVGVAWAVAATAVAGPYGKRIGIESASGDYAVATASGTGHKPRAIHVQVRTRPGQGFDASWSVTCSRGFGAGSKSGSFTGFGRRAKRIRLPMRRADTCYVAATGQLEDSGRIVVSIHSRRR